MAFMSAQLPSTIGCLTNADSLDSKVPTFAHAFAAAGYETVLCGRMHFEGPDQRHGFNKRLVSDVNWPRVGGSGRVPSLKQVLGELAGTTGPNARAIKMSGPGESGYLEYDRVVTDAAVKWLAGRNLQSAEEPFLLTVGYVQPHAPFVATEEDYSLYDEQVAIDDLPVKPVDQLHPELRRLRRIAGLEDPEQMPSAADERRARVAYHGMCTFLDRQVGRVLAQLAKSGLEENTIVVYLSDHGEQLGEHGMWWKHTFYEGSVGIPMLIAGPGIPQRRAVTRNVSLIDVGPTLLDLCGAGQIPATAGQSFRCLWDGDPDQWPDEVIAENIWPPTSTTLHRMLRKNEWKLNTYYEFEDELFNLEDDPAEENNLAEESKWQELRSALHRRLDAAGNADTMVEKLKQDNVTRPWIAGGFQKDGHVDPDKPWFEPEHPPANYFHSGN